jgi:hypothetical protein
VRVGKSVPQLAGGVHYRVYLGGYSKCFAAIVTEIKPAAACRGPEEDCVSLYVLPPPAFSAPSRGRLDHVQHDPVGSGGGAWHFNWECPEVSGGHRS